jgi:serine/threonine protein kinase
MDQASLEKTVKVMIQEVSPKRSSNSLRFAVACLQLTPINRITAAEAECHDWFCTPQKHFEFFQQLDQRFFEDVSDDTQLKPMPWDLDSLQVFSPTTTPDKISGHSGENSAQWGSSSCVEKSGYFGDAQKDTKSAELELATKLSSPSQESKAPLFKAKPAVGYSEAYNAAKTLKTLQNSSRKGYRKVEARILTAQQSRICDVLQLPLTDLDRHLKPANANSKNHREEVLAELKRLDAQFLTKKIQITLRNESTGAKKP